MCRYVYKLLCVTIYNNFIMNAVSIYYLFYNCYLLSTGYDNGISDSTDKVSNKYLE